MVREDKPKCALYPPCPTSIFCQTRPTGHRHLNRSEKPIEDKGTDLLSGCAVFGPQGNFEKPDAFHGSATISAPQGAKKGQIAAPEFGAGNPISQ
jgi:hypothetical protein